MSRLLIVNADDFGLSPGVNAGILEAHTRGVVTSTSLMVNRAGSQQAGELASRYPSLSVGLHFAEEEGVDVDDRQQATREFGTQLERFRELMGADPTHVDSHHHVHASGARMAVFAELVAPLGVPLRHDGHVEYLGGFWAQWEPGVTELRYIRREFLLDMVRSEVSDGFTELACHPAQVNGDFSSSYLEERAVELQTLTQPGLREEIEGLGVSLVSYHDWHAGQAAGG